MGAPLAAYTRISESPIRVHCSIYEPNVVVVLDPTLIRSVNVAQGIVKDGVIVINTTESSKVIKEKIGVTSQKVWTVPATDIAIKILNAPITNTAVLGAATRAASLVKLESIEKAIRGRFREELAERNIAVIQEAYEQVKLE
jgi:2-oxoacid:acceptor oxidoreductase gamma subunit (pyruvate/2-ketoisovalerate family)